MGTVGIVWLRRDLRLADNPALVAALSACRTVIPVYVHAPDEEAPWRPGAASDAWLHRGLTALDASLRGLGSRLVIRRGPTLDALRALAVETAATHLYWNRRYEPAAVGRDRAIEDALREAGLIAESCNAGLLNEPWQVTRDDGGPYRVFTPFWKACQRAGIDAAPAPAPAALPPVPPEVAGLPVEALGLAPRIGWDRGFWEAWQPGEAGARAALAQFLAEAVAHYDEDRNRPDRVATSRLSPHLHFGEIGPRQIVAAVRRPTAEHSAAAPAFPSSTQAYASSGTPAGCTTACA
jgi:deoxyribodipyrimidine photo-lyase